MAVSGSEVWLLAMAARKKYDASRLEEAAREAAVDQTKRIEAELQKEAEQNKAFNSIKFELDCRRVIYTYIYCSPLALVSSSFY